MTSRVLLLLLVAAVAGAMVDVKTGQGGHGSPGAVALNDRWIESPFLSAVKERRPTGLSHYWRAERSLVAALKREGRLGAEVRRLRHAARVQRRARTLQAVGTSELERSFLCIHAGEAPWGGTDNATHNTYFGGLQMDREFQQSYGPEFLRAWGTADHWPQSVQITVAIRAYLSGRGFAPWPNTSRACGLR